MKRAILAIIAAVTALASVSCGARLNKQGDPEQYFDTVLPGGGVAEEEDKPAVADKSTEKTRPPKYSKYFDVAVKETESGILYLPYIDDDGSETGDIIVVGYNGTSLNVTVPSIIDGGNVRAISEGAFFGKTIVTSVVLPDSVTEIGRAAFSSCPNLRSIKFGRGITELPPAVLRNCRVLSDVTLPDTLEVIGDFAFEGCIMLEHLYIPASVKEIGHDAFMTCERLTLDVSDNEYAAEYAREYNINTDERFSYAAFRKRVAIGVSVGAAIAAISLGGHFYLRRRKEKRAW
ncbi:MAG: leucine-rich repeat domain-containing protein [Eubacteriales bacterium]|jgi:hypothetical protein|nr:leucine-rich repeat domain-containing protein [Clostridiales bacterium]